MSEKPFGVGIIGLQPGRSWAAVAHVPALRALADDFEIIGVANSNKASAEAAAAVCDLPNAFESVTELIACPAVDIVSVTVKVPHHFDLVAQAIAAGKHVYCEWPLGNGREEARELARRANAKGVVAVAGTQARVAPEIQYLRQLIAGGYVGKVLSTSLIGSGMILGPTVEPRSVYLLDRSNGATMLTIPVGHTLAAVREVLGEVTELSAQLVNRRTSARLDGTNETIPMTSHDQILLNAQLEGGARLSLHYRGGLTRGTGLLWEINGTEGDIQVSGANGHAQMVQLTLAGARGDERVLQSIEAPASFYAGLPEDVLARNVACMYARMSDDLLCGTRSAPSFDDAVILHSLIATIERSGETGCRMAPALAR